MHGFGFHVGVLDSGEHETTGRLSVRDLSVALNSLDEDEVECEVAHELISVSVTTYDEGEIGAFCFINS